MVATAPMQSVTPAPRLWPGSTVVCIGSGPSLLPADVDYCRDRARVIAIKDTHRIAPWADVLYCGDEFWWQAYRDSIAFAGLRFALASPEQRWLSLLEACGVHRLTIGDATRLESDPTRLATGGHSGYQAINLAVHLGAARVVLLGYDMKPADDGRAHYFGSHAYSKKKPPFQWLDTFNAMPARLAELGVTVLNASRETALTVFPRVSLEEALTV